jgi:Carboxypeptidase regulatory-like domain
MGLLVGAVLVWTASTSAAQTRATITGTVKDASGAVQTGVTVVLTTPAGIDRRQTSGVDGTYTFGGLAPGDYRLRVDDPNSQYAPWSQDKITVAAGDRATVDVALQPRIAPGQQRGAISGTVIGPLGQPLGGVTVALSGTGGNQQATSTTSGAYTFGNLAAGTYQVKIAAQKDSLAFQGDSFALAAGERRSVDVHLQPLPPPAAPAPAPTANANPALPPLPAPVGMEAQPDRWNFQYPVYSRYAGQKSIFATGGPLDPYNQNTLKADRPLGGDTFFNLNLQLNSTINPSDVAEGNPNGGTKKLVFNENHVFGAAIFGGDTVFEPRRWALQETTVFNLNRADDGSLSFGGLKANAAEKTNLGVEELFGEARLAVLSPNFDFMSVRGGMQNFNVDFRGYLFDDNQLGVRLFGNAKNNTDQYNVAVFSMRTRDAVSQLHDITTGTGETVIMANYFIQDFVAQGYTFMVNVLQNRDTRPNVAGDLSATYVGFHGDGHWGGLSVSHAFYQVFGHDDDNTLAVALKRPSHLSINARMAAIEASHDSDAVRLRGSFFYASGDSGTNPGTAGGFDSVQDNPELAGGQFSFWTQEAIKVPGLPGGGLLQQRFSLLPDLRDKFSQRSNFLNPGLILVNGGVDFRLMPQLKVVTNLSYLRFANVSTLQALTSAAKFPNATIGLDANVGLKWRPFLNENLFFVEGFGLLKPQGGMATALGSAGLLFSMFSTFQIAF